MERRREEKRGEEKRRGEERTGEKRREEVSNGRPTTLSPHVTYGRSNCLKRILHVSVYSRCQPQRRHGFSQVAPAQTNVVQCL